MILKNLKVIVAVQIIKKSMIRMKIITRKLLMKVVQTMRILPMRKPEMITQIRVEYLKTAMQTPNRMVGRQIRM